MTIFSQAPEVRVIAQRLIDKWHPHLRAIRIEYVFRDKAARHHNRLVRGTAKKVGGVNALLATPKADVSEDLDFFLITIARDLWEQATPRERDALVDHELSHCHVDIDDEGYARLVTRGHDLEAFSTEVERHGPWTGDLEIFITSLPAEQLALLGSPLVSPGQAPANADGEPF